MATTAINIRVALNGRNMRNIQTITHLITGNADYKSPVVRDAAIRLIENYRAVAPADMHFMSALVSDENPALSAVQKRERYVQIPLVGVGAFAVPAGSRLSDENIAVVINRVVDGGRGGRIFLRNFLTTDEYNTIAEGGAYPVRFTDPNNLPDAFVTNFIEGLNDSVRLLPAGGDSGLRHIVGFDNTPKIVERFELAGVSVSKMRRRRRTANASLAAAMQKKLNSLARAAWAIVRGRQLAAVSAEEREKVNALKDEAKEIYDSAPAEVVGKLRYPDFPGFDGV